MRRLWFRQCYVEPILSGSKRSTIRRARGALPIGTLVHASVGPRTPFALLSIGACELRTIDTFPTEERDELVALYPDETMLAVLSFNVIEAYSDPRDHHKATQTDE